MEKGPVELEPGRLGCPDCRHPLVLGLAPFHYKGHNLGAFDDIVCEMRGYGLLTEKGCDDTGEAVAARDDVETLREEYADVEIKVMHAPKAPTVTSSDPSPPRSTAPPPTALKYCRRLPVRQSASWSRIGRLGGICLFAA